MSHNSTDDHRVDELLAQLGDHVDTSSPPSIRALSRHALDLERLATPWWPLLTAASICAASLVAMYLNLLDLEEVLMLHAL